MRALLAFAAVAAATPSPGSELLAAFKAAPVGHRLAALAHEPILAVPVVGDEVAVVVYAPEQGTLSRWDDESRVVLYRRATPDWERVQFVSKAGESVPGRIAALHVRDVDGDGLAELVAIGRAHGQVGKATLMVFRRDRPGGKFEVIFRRRQAAPAFTFGLGGRLTYTYESPLPARERRFETFALEGGMYVPAAGDAQPVVLD